MPLLNERMWSEEKTILTINCFTDNNWENVACLYIDDDCVVHYLVKF